MFSLLAPPNKEHSNNNTTIALFRAVKADLLLLSSNIAGSAGKLSEIWHRHQRRKLNGGEVKSASYQVPGLLSSANGLEYFRFCTPWTLRVALCLPYDSPRLNSNHWKVIRIFLNFLWKCQNDLPLSARPDPELANSVKGLIYKKDLLPGGEGGRENGIVSEFPEHYFSKRKRNKRGFVGAGGRLCFPRSPVNLLSLSCTIRWKLKRRVNMHKLSRMFNLVRVVLTLLKKGSSARFFGTAALIELRHYG